MMGQTKNSMIIQGFKDAAAGTGILLGAVAGTAAIVVGVAVVGKAILVTGIFNAVSGIGSAPILYTVAKAAGALAGAVTGGYVVTGVADTWFTRRGGGSDITAGIGFMFAIGLGLVASVFGLAGGWKITGSLLPSVPPKAAPAAATAPSAAAKPATLYTYAGPF